MMHVVCVLVGYSKTECFLLFLNYEVINELCVCVYLQVSEGLVLRDGTRLKYPINGIAGSCFMVVFCQTLHVILSHV